MLNEEFLSLIIYVCAERYCKGIGVVDFEEQVRREIVHLLAGGPKPHSKIQKQIGSEVVPSVINNLIIQMRLDVFDARLQGCQVIWENLGQSWSKV